jgi:hypothetical protein
VNRWAVCWLFLLGLNGCYPWDPCEDLPRVQRQRTALSVRMVVNSPELHIKVSSPFRFEKQIVTRTSPSLGDTVQLFVYGDETYYKQLNKFHFTIDSQVVYLDFRESDSVGVQYMQPDEWVKILNKKACEPIPSGIQFDSIQIEASPLKTVTLDFV